MVLRSQAFSLFLGATLFAFASACTKAVPTIQDLGSLSGFGVDQSRVTGTSFLLTGTCQDQYTAIEISLDNGQSWAAPANYSSDFALNCSSSGNYSGHMTFSSIYPSFLVRGVAPLGYSNSVVVAMAATTPSRPQLLSAGAGPLTGTGYKLSGSIVSQSAAATASGGSYKLKGIILAQ